MIAHLRGRIAAKSPNHVIVDVGGVGYEVTISIPTYASLPERDAEVALHIYTHVREDALALFGFLHAAEKQLFEKLIGVSGIGPKLAITILSGMAAEAMARAIRGNDVAALTRIPGIGKKTAERMVLELRDKVEALVAAEHEAAATATPVEEDVLSALVNLGYNRGAAEKAVAAAAKNGGAQTFESLFRNAMAAMR